MASSGDVLKTFASFLATYIPLTRERLEYGLRLTHARGRALADSQDQRRLSDATACHLVGSLERTIDVVCAELGKPNAEMPSRRRM